MVVVNYELLHSLSYVRIMSHLLVGERSLTLSVVQMERIVIIFMYNYSMYMCHLKCGREVNRHTPTVQFYCYAYAHALHSKLLHFQAVWQQWFPIPL